MEKRRLGVVEMVQGLNGEKEVRRSGEGEGTGETWRRGGYG